MRPPASDPVLAAHLLTCPPCREAGTLPVALPALRDTVVPPRVWAGILGEVHRRQRGERRRQPALTGAATTPPLTATDPA